MKEQTEIMYVFHVLKLHKKYLHENNNVLKWKQIFYSHFLNVYGFTFFSIKKNFKEENK